MVGNCGVVERARPLDRPLEEHLGDAPWESGHREQERSYAAAAAAEAATWTANSPARHYNFVRHLGHHIVALEVVHAL